MLQSILRLVENTTPTPSPLPLTHDVDVQQVAFLTDHATKPISKIELQVLKGEWSVFKRPHQPEIRAYPPAESLKERLGPLVFGNRPFERLSTDAKSKLGEGWEYFTRKY
ncbi:hypothetical protein K438DRAFT_1952497 [Mycena galopus ATCC 62051]|nr:hypothetical protein K438DRAFT_1952497 [Mycena galopus ATCC 62051]